jgi:ubiquinone biosynthesis protein
VTTVADAPPVPPSADAPEAASVFGTLPPREQIAPPAPDDESLWLHLAKRRREPSVFRVLLRSMRWMLAISVMMGSALADAVRGRRGARDRGRRLRRLFERMGGTAVKVGQQMSVRIDLLPYEVCEELALLQDSVEAFDVRYAIERIEQTTGRPLGEVFESFDPDPIGSASIACVYRATLRTGEAVAVKVRRPGIEIRFLTDLRFLDWMTKSLEMMALVKPDFFKHFRIELREMLLEELDFEREVRYQRLFRREARKARLRWLSAPKVFSGYCGEDVIVSEYVEGVWCRELLAAVAAGDREALAKIESMGIAPRKVAHRLLYVQFWSSYEGLFFHADPHPSNILITEGGRVLFLDFGACGTTSGKVRRYQQALLDHLVENEVSGMVDAAMHLLAPLPPIDLHEFRKRIEVAYHRQVYAVRDPDAEWWERTTMGLWLAMVQVTQEFKVPINLDVIRQFRASLLYDTLAFRLDPDLKLPRLYRRYRREAIARMAKHAMRQRLRVSPRERRERAMGRTVDTVKGATNAMREAETFMGDLPVHLEAAVNKGAYVAKVVLYFVLATVAVVGVLGVTMFGEISLVRLFERILRTPAFLIVPALFGFKALRHIFFRLAERDLQAGRRLS